jgi:excinuclease ABC subunit A
MQKPDEDSIEGLSPAISTGQKTTSRNPRSTVGTVTDLGIAPAENVEIVSGKCRD